MSVPVMLTRKEVTWEDVNTEMCGLQSPMHDGVVRGAWNDFVALLHADALHDPCDCVISDAVCVQYQNRVTVHNSTHVPAFERSVVHSFYIEMGRNPYYEFKASLWGVWCSHMFETFQYVIRRLRCCSDRIGDIWICLHNFNRLYTLATIHPIMLAQPVCVSQTVSQAVTEMVAEKVPQAVSDAVSEAFSSALVRAKETYEKLANIVEESNESLGRFSTVAQLVDYKIKEFGQQLQLCVYREFAKQDDKFEALRGDLESSVAYNSAALNKRFMGLEDGLKQSASCGVLVGGTTVGGPSVGGTSVGGPSVGGTTVGGTTVGGPSVGGTSVGGGFRAARAISGSLPTLATAPAGDTVTVTGTTCGTAAKKRGVVEKVNSLKAAIKTKKQRTSKTML